MTTEDKKPAKKKVMSKKARTEEPAIDVRYSKEHLESENAMIEAEKAMAQLEVC